MTRLVCTVTECRWYDKEEQDCTLDEIRIIDTFHADAPAACEGYDEREEKE